MESTLSETAALNEAYGEWMSQSPEFNEIAYLEEIGYLSKVGEIPTLLLETY